MTGTPEAGSAEAGTGASPLRERIARARDAGRALAALPGERRSALLRALAEALGQPDRQAAILAANRADLEAGRAAVARGELNAALVKRLGLDGKKLVALADGLVQLARMPELTGQVTTRRLLDEGLLLERVTCPLGVLGVVFEARPDALVQIAGLAWKSGNAVVMKGGKEALGTNRELARVAGEVLAAQGLDPGALVLLEDRAGVAELLGQEDLVDLMIARGSSEFIHHVRASTRIPVLAHADGICHVFLHASADPRKAAAVVVDGKCSYPAACNATETLLWQPGAEAALDACVAALRERKVELRGCPATRARHPDLVPATAADWDTEYGALVLSVRQVPDLPAALAHIAEHGSRHTDAIVAEDRGAAEAFLAAVDTACCFHNASTRFSDGYRFGLGAEVGISTDKLHARGPVGVEGLITYRWLLRGDGHASADYGEGGRAFLHRDLPI